MFKALDLWLPGYVARQKWRPVTGKATHIMLCVCDHFEPFHKADKTEALNRMALWKREWPKLISEFQDADGMRPRHSFFYPVEQYDRDVITELAELCGLSGGETEIHLHHKDDTSDGVRSKLEKGKADLLKHDLLSRDEKGAVRYGFIHGNWALDNSHPDNCFCGVDNEIEILAQTGCYADFTMPSAPDRSQTSIVNSLYYATEDGGPKSHNRGVLCEANGKSRRSEGKTLLLVQGPLGLNWKSRKLGLLPRIENSDLTGANPPTPTRMQLWLNSGVHVQGKPEWVFIKLHTHGAIPRNSGMFLGEAMRNFHRHLMEHYRDTAQFKLHYVTARELVNILHAAEDGKTGAPGQFRNYRYRMTQ